VLPEWRSVIVVPLVAAGVLARVEVPDAVDGASTSKWPVFNHAEVAVMGP
jgi:hypothetical protein